MSYGTYAVVHFLRVKKFMNDFDDQFCKTKIMEKFNRNDKFWKEKKTKKQIWLRIEQQKPSKFGQKLSGAINSVVWNG